MTGKILKISLWCVASLLCLQAVNAQNPADEPLVEEPTIIDHINDCGKNVIIVDEQVRGLLEPAGNVESEKKTSTGRRIVYRVQVFSDNKGERSRQEAISKERTVKHRFSDYPTHVVYSSPYWRLQVGSFNSQPEAEELAQRMKKAFPAYSREIHVVRARVSIRTEN